MSGADGRQVLIFDADDTLWENNALFERVIEDFLGWLAHPDLSRDEVRAVLDDIEAANAHTHGYGAKMLLRSLHDTFARIGGRPATPADTAAIDALAQALVDRTVELIPGVAPTLDELATRHDLLLLTKGDLAEQQEKIEASQLAHHFSRIHIVAEKNVDTYRTLIAEHDLDPARSWMIGNSPKSDIKPAVATGLNAVFIPNEHTWVLEHDVLDADDARVLTLTAFPELLQHF